MAFIKDLSGFELIICSALLKITQRNSIIVGLLQLRHGYVFAIIMNGLA
jgi:hypothetical protein